MTTTAATSRGCAPRVRARRPRLRQPHARVPVPRVLRDQRGLATVEYTIVLVLLAALAVGAWSQFGGAIEKNASHAHTTIRDYLTPDSKGTD